MVSGNTGSRDRIDPRRRRIIQGAGTIAGVALAGCTGDEGGDGTTATGGDDTTTTGGDGTGDSSGDTPVFTVAKFAEQNSLDPAKFSSTGTEEWVYNFYNGLLKYAYDSQEGMAIVPDLAESYEVLEEDGELLAQFVLRDDVEYHNGEPLTAELVKTEIDYWWDSPSTTGLEFADRVSMDDDRTINIHLDFRAATFEDEMCGAGRLIANPYLREERGEGEFSNNPKGAGTGPYEMVNYESGSQIEFEKYDGYHEEGIPKFDEFRVSIIPESSTRVARLQTGELLLDNYGVRPSDWQSLQNSDTLETKSSDSTIMTGIVWNLNAEEGEPLRDKRVRQALSKAVDREAFIGAVYQGVGDPISLPTFPGLGFGYPDVHDTNPYAPDEARQLLADAGYSDGFEIPLNSSAAGYHRRMGSAIKDMWGEIGVDVLLDPIDNTTMWSNVYAGNFVAIISQMGAIPDPDTLVRQFMLSGDQGELNFVRGWENEEYTTLVQDAYRTMDHEERQELYRRAYEILAEEQPFPFFARAKNLTLHNKNLKGYWDHPYGWNYTATRDVYWEE